MKVYLGPNGNTLGEGWPTASLYGFHPIKSLVRQWTLNVVTTFMVVNLSFWGRGLTLQWPARLPELSFNVPGGRTLGKPRKLPTRKVISTGNLPQAESTTVRLFLF